MIGHLQSLKRFRIHSGQQDHLPVRLNPRLRQAQFPGTTVSNSARPFTLGQLQELETFRPQVLIGSQADLQFLAQRFSNGQCQLESIDHALIAVTRVGEEPLSDLKRVVLWQAFGVPVYEILADANGLLLAAECEAHEGWHVRPSVRAFLAGHEVYLQRGNRKAKSTGYTGEIVAARCDCGRETARLLNIRPNLRARDVRESALAAIA